ncbi:MAG TPA: hypothetical protein GX707_12515, partial [Epulopiscium sp.]|nr:hypothetical protein [Candidatus Epulonipiscium sp.]
MRINHNIPALRTLHQMNKTNSKIDKTMQRLSSGLRINSAADDAAGLAIAQKMDTQVRGLQQANRNSMDGISLIQTAEGALNEVHSMLQRTRELAIQASNGTLTPTDRKAITDEVAQLKAEIDRISEHIEYNERKLLNGEIDRRAFSNLGSAGKVISMSDGVGARDYTFNVEEAASQTAVVGKEVIATDTIFNTETPPKVKEGVDGFLNINGEQVKIEEGDSPQDVFAKIRDLCDTMGIDLAVKGGGTYEVDDELVMIHREYGAKDIKILGDESILKGLGLFELAEDATPGADGINKGSDLKLAKATVADPDLVPFTTGSDDGDFPPGTTFKIVGNIITFEANNGFKLVVEGGKSVRNPENGDWKDNAVATGTSPTSALLKGEVTLSLLETGPLDLQIGANQGQMMQLRIQNMSTGALGLTDMNLNTAAKSQEAITLVDNAIAQVSSARSKLGAYQNRLEHTVANLDVAAENMTASMSRIQDADMAAEMAEYTKDNILAQAGNAMLA